MTKNPFLNALSATAYISTVSFLMFYGSKYVDPVDTVFSPIAMLSLLVFSVAMMAFIFFYQPIQMYLDGEKKEGAKLFLKTLLFFGFLTGSIFLFLSLNLNLSNSYKDATYIIDGKSVTLKNGESSGAKYFGNEAVGDLNNDGTEDVAFLLTQDGGGSGTFYYVVVALNYNGKYRGVNAVLLGDRIAPQTTEIRNGELIVNYADRRSGEPMTTRPSMGVSKYLKISERRLVVVK